MPGPIHLDGWAWAPIKYEKKQFYYFVNCHFHTHLEISVNTYLFMTLVLQLLIFFPIMLIIGLDDQGLSKYVSVWKSSELGFFRHDLFCCCCVVLPTLFAMSRVSYLLVRGSFNLAFLVTFAFYFQVVKVTKSFGIKRNYFYWWADAIYHCKCTNN